MKSEQSTFLFAVVLLLSLIPRGAAFATCSDGFFIQSSSTVDCSSDPNLVCLGFSDGYRWAVNIQSGGGILGWIQYTCRGTSVTAAYNHVFQWHHIPGTEYVKTTDKCRPNDPLFFKKSVDVGPAAGMPERILGNFAAFNYPAGDTDAPLRNCLLSDVARALNYDHFNWINVVTSHPDPSAIDPPQAEGHFLDPPFGGGESFGGVADYLPYYWDEGPVLIFINHINDNLFYHSEGATYAATLDTANVIRFYDTPSWRGLGPNKRIEFTTSLVGVPGDGRTLHAFKWDTTFNGTTGGVHMLRSTGDPDPGSGTGGIENVFQHDRADDVDTNVKKLWGSLGVYDYLFIDGFESGDFYAWTWIR